MTIYGLHAFSRYTISVQARPKQRRDGVVESSEIEVKGSKTEAIQVGIRYILHPQVITPQSPPTLRIEELAVVENEATKLSFTWAQLPRDDPRVVLKQAECERFESRLGNSTKILFQGLRL